jgi:hypothetical protein
MILQEGIEGSLLLFLFLSIPKLQFGMILILVSTTPTSPTASDARRNRLLADLAASYTTSCPVCKPT